MIEWRATRRGSRAHISAGVEPLPEAARPWIPSWYRSGDLSGEGCDEYELVRPAPPAMPRCAMCTTQLERQADALDAARRAWAEQLLVYDYEAMVQTKMADAPW